MKKRIISLLVALGIVVSFMYQLAPWANATTIKSGSCGESVIWKLDDLGTLTISGSGKMSDFDNVGPWYKYEEMDQIKSIIIDDGITYIGNHAFMGCSSVKSVSVSNTVTEIGYFAFDNCSALETITLPTSITKIGAYAFSGCTSLESITIPESVLDLGDGVFDCCWNLSEITFLGNVPTMYVPNPARYEYGTFWNIAVTAYYPADNSTWTSAVLNEYYGGEITWVAVEVNNTHSNETTEKESTSDMGYISAVQKAIEETQCYSWGDGYGVLHDVDGNGIEELIMVYTVNTETENGYAFPAKVCSVYTLSNGTAVQLIDKEVLFAEAGGPSGHVAVVESNGSIYFAITFETGETGGGPGYSINRYGGWKLYTIDGTSLNLDATIEYDYFCEDQILYNKSTATIDGQKCSFKEYELWKNTLNEIISVEPYGNEGTMTLEELLKHLKEHPIKNESKSEGIVVYSDYANLNIRKGSAITLTAGILTDGERSEDVTGINFQIEDTSILKMSTTDIKDNYRYVKLKGLAEGTTTVTFTDSNTGYTATVPITVYSDNYLSYTLNSVPTQNIEKYPTNIYNANGLYVDNYKYTVNDDQSATVSFDVYNTNYIYGSVEVFDENGNMKDAILIEKMTSSNTSIKEALWDNIGYLVRDIIDGDLLSYRQESGYSKKTSVSVKIPKNGYVRITTDPDKSLIVGLVNSVDGLMSMVSLAGDIKDFDVNSKEFSKKLTKKLLADQVYVELIKDGSDASKKLWENVGKETFITSESMGSFTDTITKNIDELKLGSIIADTAADFGWNIGENVFAYFAGPAGTALNIMFTIGKVENLIIQQNDLIQSAGVGSIYIQNQGGGIRACQQIKVESEDSLSPDTALNVFTVTLDSTILDIIEDLNPEIYEAISNGITRTYNISLIRSGEETQPNGKVTVYIPISEDFKALAYAGDLTGKIKIYRVEEDGGMTEMDVEIDDGCFVFTTDHFSLYTIVGYDFENTKLQNNEQSNQPLIIGVVSVAVVALGVIGILIFKKKKKTA